MSENTRTNENPRRFPWVSLLLGVGVLLFAAQLVSTSIRSKTIALGQEMMADDFGFTIIGTTRLHLIIKGDESIRPKGEFLIVELQVANHAQRVDFCFDPAIVVLEDSLGERIHLCEPGQRLIDEMGLNSTTLAHGEVCRRKIAFDVDPTASPQRLRIAFGGRFGEMLDWFFHGDRTFALSKP